MNIRKNVGITLIMLVVTIITLLIIAGVTISAITGGESTIDKAGQAKNETEIQAEMEELQEVITKSASKGVLHGNFSGSADATSIRSALKKNNLIVEDPDEIIIDGKSEWIVTGNKTNTQYAIQYNGEVIRLIDTGSIKVGDTVNYTPSGTYNWDAEYATSYEVGTTDYTNANITLDSSKDDFKITTWKVLSIDNKTGNIELVPSNTPTGKVTLHGAQGYNNAVYLLNEACNKLYGNSNKGIIARNIKIEDFEKVGGNTWMNFRNSQTDYGQQYDLEYTSNKSYPLIYKDEIKSVIDSNEIKKGLGQSEQTELINRTINQGNVEVNNQYKTATNSIQPYKTSYHSR